MPLIPQCLRAIRFPTLKECAVLVSLVALYVFGAAFVINGDGSYAYAMLEKMADPGAFASNDLTIKGNIEGNFLFYRLLFYLPFFSHNFVFWDFAISSVLSILLLLAWYNVFLEFSGRRVVATTALGLLLFVDARLSLGGTTLPLFYLTSIASVLFAQTFALFFFIRGSPIFSFALLSLTTYFHPPSGLFFLAVLGLFLLIQSVKEHRYRTLVYAVGIAAIIFLPNAVLISHRIGFSGDTKLFFEVFRALSGPHAGHNYVESYWQAYVMSLASWLLVLVALPKIQFSSQSKKTIQWIIGLSFLVVGLGLINLYFFHYLQIFYLYFAMRSTYLLKPLFVFLFVVIAFDLHSKRTVTSLCAAGCLLASLFIPSLVWSLAVLFVAFVYLFFDIEGQSWAIRFNAAIGSFLTQRLIRVFQFLFLLILCAGIFLFLYNHNNKLQKVFRLFQGENTFNFSFRPEKNFGLNNASPALGEVIDWAKQDKGKMFITPPDNCGFSFFRFIAKNSVYTNVCDVFQLNYTPVYFLQAYDRFLSLDVRYIGWGQAFDYSGYNVLNLMDIRTRNEADFIIFDKTSIGYWQRPETPVFENNQFIIYSLR